ncbi:glycosyltransferase family 2 protein, partial [Vibrio cholerae]
MNSNAEMISVVIPSYNHSQYIAEAINSVLNERCEDFEIQLIVIDDCSTDNTQEIVEQLLEYFDFEFYRNEYNLGITSTLEKSISFIRGDYICFLGSDDFFLPGRLKKQLDEIKKQGLDAIYAKGKSFDAGSNWIADHNLSDFARALDKSQGDAFRLIAIDDTNGPLFQSSMLRTEVIKDIADLWKEYNSDDWIVLLYLLKEKNVSYLDEFVFGYRLHGSNSHKK